MIPQTARALVLSGVMKCNQKGFNLITLRIDEPSLHTLNIDPNFYLNKKSSDKNHQSTRKGRLLPLMLKATKPFTHQ